MRLKEQYLEHEAGWDLLENEVRLFSLYFLETRGNYFYFKIEDLQTSCSLNKASEILNSSLREPRLSVAYKNRLTKSLISDSDFFGAYRDGVAVLTDFRPIEPLWWQGLFASSGSVYPSKPTILKELASMDLRFTKEVDRILKSAGWYPGRRNAVVDQLEFSMHQPGIHFLSEFGELFIAQTIITDAEEINSIYQDRKRIESVPLSNCLPIATSFYWGDAGELWMDELGRFYQADSYELAQVSNTIGETFEILTLHKKEIQASMPRWAIQPRPKRPWNP